MTELERMVFAAAMVAAAHPETGNPWGDVNAGARAVAAQRLEVNSFKPAHQMGHRTPYEVAMMDLKNEVSRG